MKPAILITTALLASTAQAGDRGSLARASSLLQKPALDAPVVAELAAKTGLEVLARQSAWMQVKADGGKSGWLKMLNVRLDEQAGGGLSGKLFTASSSTTATAGVKGMGEEDRLREAQPDLAALEAMSKLASNADEATAHAKAVKLQASQLPYPASVTTSGTNNAAQKN